jgi:HEPN domain-containing protein
MSRRDGAEHLDKAEQFFATAELALAAGMHDAAASNAVLAGIRACDAICAARVGRYAKAQSHGEAVALVRQSGAEGRQAATLLTRLLTVKSKAQYDTTKVSADAARRTVESARRILVLAKDVLRG